MTSDVPGNSQPLNRVLHNKSVKCPICKKSVDKGDPYWPFCSDRCRLLDLGNWASGRYVISTPIRNPDDPSSEDREPDDEG